MIAAAGVDASNTVPGTVLTLPHDADAVARELRRDLRALGLPLLAVVISDTAGRPWRTGQTDFALGCAGLMPSDDLRGTRDTEGQLLEVTERAVADEVAAAADLAKGKVSGTPVALARGLAAFVTDDDGPGARSLLRGAAEDWFRYGHAEAVRLALGVEPDVATAPHVGPEPMLERVSRALDTACHGYPAVGAELARDGRQVVVSLQGNAFALGGVCARLLAALWAEDLDGVVEPGAGAGVNAPAGAASVRVAERV